MSGFCAGLSNSPRPTLTNHKFHFMYRGVVILEQVLVGPLFPVKGNFSATAFQDILDNSVVLTLVSGQMSSYFGPYIL